MGIRLSVDPQTLHIELSGLDAVLAIKKRLDVPVTRITAVRSMARGEVPYQKGTWLRLPGTYVPGLARYGSYGRHPDRDFWAVAGRRRVLVVEIGDWDYSRLVLGVVDPDTHVATISAYRR